MRDDGGAAGGAADRVTSPQTAAAPDADALARRLTELADAVGSQRLAGLEPSAATVALLRRVARGELAIEHVLADTRARIAAGDI